MDEEYDYFEPYECPLHPGELINGYCEDPYATEIGGDPDATMPNCVKCVKQAAEDI